MAVPLSECVDTYTAVECDPVDAYDLRAAGLNVVEDIFPVPMDRTYDVVLSCQSVPEGSVTAYPRFLDGAWACTGSTGLMLIVTFKGSTGAVADVRRALLGVDSPRSPELEAIVEYCKSHGTTSMWHCNSYVEAAAAGELAEFLSPWLAGQQETRERLRQSLIDILEAEYRVRERLFVFPTQHVFISCYRGSGPAERPA